MRLRSRIVSSLTLVLLLALGLWYVRRMSDSDLVTAARARSDATDAATPARSPELEGDGVAQNDVAMARADVAPPPVAQPSVPTTMVIGRVLTPDGKPIVGARARRGTEDELGRARLDPAALFELGERELATPTDLEGRFVFSGVPASGEMLIVGPEHVDFVAEQPWRIARPGAECVFVMEPLLLGELRVEAVHARTGEGLAYFEAVVTLLDRSGLPRRFAGKFPGHQGAAGGNVRFVPGSSLEVGLLVTPMAIGRGPSTVRSVRPIEGDVVVVRFELDPATEPVADGAFVATGLVVEHETGAPIAGARVASAARPDPTVAQELRRDRPQYAVSTDSDGRFRVRLGAEDCLLRVSAPLRLPGEREVRGGEDVRIELMRGTYVEVRVVTRDGKPAQPRFVSFERSEPELRAQREQFVVQTNDVGVWTAADMTPGRWEIRVSRATSRGARTSDFLTSIETASGPATVLTADAIVRTVELTPDAPAEIVFEVDD